MAGDDSEVVVVGRVLRPYGIRGWVHLASFTDPGDNILTYRPWLLRAGEVGDWRAAEVEEIKPHQHGFVARFQGIGDRDGAESLRGRWIGVPASELPVAEPEEYYWRDLLGLAVVDTDGRTIGEVADLIETGANDVLVVKQVDGTETLIPFHRQFVLDADPAAGRIRVDWPAD
jgi:16S rRNA processing protein RimM